MAQDEKTVAVVTVAPAKPMSKTEAAANVIGLLNVMAERLAGGADHGPVIDILRALQRKDGVRTTEFWLSSLLCAVGTALSFSLPPGREVQGGLMLLAGASLLTLSRTAVKVAEAKATTPGASTATAEVMSGGTEVKATTTTGGAQPESSTFKKVS